ncbi:methyltransferase-like protein 27 [Haliotis rubra]|uniref:methyltransferase-like protein 27 n=1 Tax=Haliotis rubra TaxID=36100 RepID=UPI001EE5BB8D|nr:methyltransferase-like protein 27 [Haliotis rubra]
MTSTNTCSFCNYTPARTVNAGAHRVGISTDEVVEYYSKWSHDGKYEQDLCPEWYKGPSIAADVVAEYFRHNVSHVNILDVAAGTGLLGEQLQDRRFKHLDALEPAAGMLEQARKKNIYTNLYCEFLDGNRLPIDDDMYDCCVISGGMGEGHIPCDGLHELIRITEQGGLICIVMCEDYLYDVTEYRGRLEKLMQKLEDDGKWKKLSRDVVRQYCFNHNGVIFNFKIC